MKIFLWCFFYTGTLIWLQKIFPNWCVDLLLPIIPVLLELKRSYLLSFYVLLWILVQEGIGNVMFGSSILVFIITFLSFFLYKRFFSFMSFFFALLLSFTVVFSQLLIVVLISFLQGLEMDTMGLFFRYARYFVIFIIFLYFNYVYFRLILPPIEKNV